jgi:formate dehydrogenase major subunit
MTRKPTRRIARALRDWSVPRQLRGAPHETIAAESEGSRTLRPRLEQADKVGTSICPYCAVGCAQLVYAKDDKPIHIEGDPRSPINQGTLCPKGAATLSLLTSPERVDTCLHRAPGATEWTRVDLDWAMRRIAHLAKRTRDEGFVARLPDGTRLNQTLNMGSLGGATLDNEENYLLKKLFSGGLGMAFIENQARV